MLMAFVSGCGTQPLPRKAYEVRYLPDAQITIDGVLDEPAAAQAKLEKDFCFPWQDRPAPPTQFRACCDDEFLYFAFKVHDEDIVVDEDSQDVNVVLVEDRVELFFAVDAALAKYFCLEIDPRGRVYDYVASHYRKFDTSWNCEGVRIGTSALEQGYLVEGAIPRETLEATGLPPLNPGGELLVGVFRAEFSHGPGPEPIENWISWVHPQTEQPDFHVPSAFGRFRIVP